MAAVEKYPGGVEDVPVITDRSTSASPDPERHRLAQADAGEQDWRAWGPYLSERAWGTVREDYSEHGTAWDYFPHDHARSRAYRWNEDGMAGVCDDRQTFCFALALWNGRDPILKERMFGLGGDGGNHGEDVKEYWWYLDSTPTHSFMRWRYHYPQAAFPYDELVAVNALRGRDDTEYELVDTGIFDDDRYWAVTVDYAKASPTDMCVLVTVANRGDEDATLHVLPTLWFRNTWAWGLPGTDRMPKLTGETAGERAGARLVGEHWVLGQLLLEGDGDPVPLLCDNETNAERLWGLPGRSPYPKDGINDHVVAGAATVNPDRTGTKGALHYVLDVPAGEQRQIRLRLTRTAPPPTAAPPAPADLGDGFDTVLWARRAEANRFFDSVIPAAATADEALVARQAIAGLMWGKQFYHFDVERWLAGDPGSAPPPAGRRHGRNSAWWHMNSF
ncbi:glucosidase, partial [Micromonospora sp. CPCC 205714]